MKLMGKNLKNKIQSIFLCPVAPSLKFNGRWFGAFFLIFLGLAIPSQFTNAQLGLLIGTAVAVTLINLVLQLILAISTLILGLAGVILNWVLSPYFMSLPYTYGGIVDIGWPIVRDFVNMLFIVALVIIGLSTALRIKEYQAQKALPLLIIIAILINFTPVICGLIMDAQNIFMNFFLEELTGFKLLGNLFTAQGTMILGALAHSYNPLEAFSLMGKTIIMIIFDWVAAFIFFMYALLFIMRYIMVWVLVIVSPLAFFSRVFPGAQKYFFKSILGWDEWWKQFIEWSMIGIIGAFFLYLGEQLMVLAPGWIPGIAPGGFWGIITTPLVDFMNQLLPWGVALAFLIIGFFMATTTSAMGAGAITSWAKKTGVGIAKSAGKGMIMRPLREEIWPRAEKALRLKEAAGWTAGKLRGVPIARHLGPVAAIEKYGEWRGDIEKAKEGAKGFSSYNIGERIRTGEAPLGYKAAGELLQVVERGDSEDYFKGMAREYAIEEKYGVKEGSKAADDLLLAGETPESKQFLKHAKDLVSTAYRGGLGNNIVRVDPRLAAVIAGEKGVGFNYTEEDETIKRSLPEGMAEQLVKKRARGEKFTSEEEKALRKAAISRAEEEARPKHIANTEREVFENEVVVDTMARTAGTDKYRSAITNVKRFVPTWMPVWDKIFENFVKSAGEALDKVSEKTAKDFVTTYENYFESAKNNYLRAAGLTAPKWFPEKYLKKYRPGVAPRTPTGGISPGLGVVPEEFEEGEGPTPGPGPGPRPRPTPLPPKTEEPPYPHI